MKRKALLVVAFLGLWTSPLAGQLAVRLYQQACDGGSMLECQLLGIMYETGNGVTQDLGNAVMLFQKACDGEMMESCYRLGVMYAIGTSGTRDLGRAVNLLQKACDGGEAQGCSQLAVLFQLMTVALLEQLPLEGRTLTMGAEGFGTLSDADPEGPDGSYAQAWALPLSAGQEVTVDLTSPDFDAYLWVTGPGLDSGLSDDDSGGGCNARMTFIAPEDGEYRVIVNAAAPRETGEFVLRASDTPPATASGLCSRVVALGPPTVPVYASTDGLPCEYEVIETVRGSSSSQGVRSLADYESIQADVLGRAGADIGADAVIAEELATGTQRRGVRRRLGLPPSAPPLFRFSGEAIRFIPGTCRTAE